MLTNMEGTRLAGYFPIEDATTNGGDASREYFSVENATTNGGDASRVGKICSYYLVAFVFSSILYPDAGRVAPISACVLCLSFVLGEMQMMVC